MTKDWIIARAEQGEGGHPADRVPRGLGLVGLDRSDVAVARLAA